MYFNVFFVYYCIALIIRTINIYMQILILSTGNSCRSQMAEGFLKEFDIRLKVFSAGTLPTSNGHPNAIKIFTILI